MAPKRPREDDGARPAKKQRKGFSVGPANLPEGTYKRKVQKIKKDLIHKAKLKKQYAKLKAREETSTNKPVYGHDESEQQDEPSELAPEPSLEPHPDRLRMLEEDSPEPEQASPQVNRRRKRPRAQPFKREAEVAKRKKKEADARQKAREEAEKERARKLAERERFRKTMAKARGGPNGRRKLGRESTVLLEKAKRLVAKT